MMEESVEEPEPPSLNAFHVLLAFLACIGGFLFGYDTGVVSGALILLKKEFELTTLWQELVVSVTVGAAAVFALLSSFPMDRLGRKPVIVSASAIFSVGAVILGAAWNRPALLAGRVIVGIGIGIASMSVPVYLAEVSPRAFRGRIVTLNVLFITFGQFVAGVIDAGFNYMEGGWRYMLGLAAIPAVIQFVGFLFMPESPRFLLSCQKDAKARAVLDKLYNRNKEAVSYEMQLIKDGLHMEARQRRDGVVLWEILKTPHVRKALIIGCALQFFQQTVGVNSVMYYSASIIEMSGVGSLSLTLWLAAIVAMINFLFTIPGLLLVDRVGRRTLVLCSLFFVTFSLLLLGVGFIVMAKNTFPVDPYGTSGCASYSTCQSCIDGGGCGYCFEPPFKTNGTCLSFEKSNSEHSTGGICANGTTNSARWASNWCPSAYSWISVLGLMLYMAFFAPGMGPMPWTINAEIFPQWARGTAVSMTTMTNWLSNLLVSMTFLSLTESITKEGTFFLYAGICVVALVFFFMVLPETKGLSLEQVEQKFKKPWLAPAVCWTRDRYRTVD